MECVSGDLGVAGRRKRGRRPKKKPKSSSSFAKAGCFEALENAGGASGDSGAESDSSLLQELTKLIIEAENQEVNSEEEEENGVDESKESALKLQQDKIEKLSASVAADAKYVRGGAPNVSVAASGIKPPSKSTPAKENPEDRRKMQQLEAAVGDHELKSAIKSLASTKSGVATDHLATCMEHVSDSYGGLLHIEEQAEESLLELAHQKHGDVDSTHDAASGSGSSVGNTTATVQATPQANKPAFRVDDAYVWAKQLFKFASAFRKHQDDFFASRDMNKDLYRSISLVHFVDTIVDLGEVGIPNERDVEGQMAGCSTIQFVHWDRPETYLGRRLRLERGRFVWRPPGRVTGGKSEDDVSDLFTNSMARVIIHDCGATLVKAKGDFRAQVPEDVLLIYKCLSAAASGGGSDGDMGPCFLCKTLTDFFCPTCQLYSHDDCCLGLAVQLAAQNAEHSALRQTKPSDPSLFESSNLSPEMCTLLGGVYRDASGDLDGSQLSSLVSFDCVEERHPCRNFLQLKESSCVLCKAALFAWEDTGLAVFGPLA